ncbi:MAG: STAS/SEC14 domain-containing protein [Chloroflexota bacterium]
MSTVRVEAQVSSDDLLKAVEQLTLPELERFVSEVVALQAQRKAPSLPQAESELLQKINQGLPDDVRTRFQELEAKRQSEALNDTEYAELLRLTDIVENIQAQRVGYLSQLARIRKISLSELMKTLGLPELNYA